MAFLMRDHPGWFTDHTGATRVLRSGSGAWLISWAPEANTVTASLTGAAGGTADEPLTDRLTAFAVEGPIGDLGHALAALGTVLRLRNSDLWDALGTAIIRQVIRAQQARDMYARFCTAHGHPVPVGHRIQHLFPAPEVVAGLPASAFAELGMAFKHGALATAAEAFLTHGETWLQLPTTELHDQLQRVRRVGPWTAGAAIADHTNDFALYPFTDLAVRTWARRAAPHLNWPERESEFGALWRRTGGPAISDLTLLTLAWEDHHARSS